MHKKRAIDRKRDASFSLEIKRRVEDAASFIVDIFAIKGQLYAFKKNSIFHIQMPDDIYPKREHHETKGSTRQLYDIGTRHYIVARTIMQAKQLTESVVFAANISKDEI